MTPRTRRGGSRRASVRVEAMERRSLLNGAWGGYAGNAQHTALSVVASQPLEAIRWQAPVDLAPQFSGDDLLIHYGSPAITSGGTMLLPVKTGAAGGFEVQARKESDGTLLSTVATDYVLPPHDWVPSYSPALTASGALAMPGIGGKVYEVDSPDTPGATVSRTLTFFGRANYDADPSAYDANVFLSTPITADAAGNLYFGFAVTGSTPLGLRGGIARIAPDGAGTYVAATAAAGDAGIVEVVSNCAPAVSNDGGTVYIAVSSGNFGRGYLLALDSATLATTGKVALMDPKSGNTANLPDDGTASPLVGPDGDVYFGVLENPFASNHDRGWLLHFDATLTRSKTFGAFGWDDTPSIVPTSMVPGYAGPSTYLLMAKYNDYAGLGGDGVNRVAVLDPNDAAVDPPSGEPAMRPVLSIAGPTPDGEHVADHAFAVREWCINTAVVDPSTGSILVNSEDGKLYRWDLSANTFSQVMTLTSGVGEAYTPTIIGPDGLVFAVNNATIFAVGATPAPVALGDSYHLDEDAPLTVVAPGVLANDTDGGGELPISAQLVSGPSHGVLTLHGDGAFTYTPNPLYFGADSFTYRATDGAKTGAPATVSLTVRPINHAPVARPDAYTVAEDGSLTVPASGVLANDTDVDPGATLMASGLAGPSHGVLALNADGSFTYTPTPLYSGPDSFAYSAGDGALSSLGVTVSLTVTPVNHAPVTNPDVYSVAEDGKLAIAARGVLANDTDVDAGATLTAQLATGPSHGVLALNADGSFTYTPSPLYRGADSFAYRASDGSTTGGLATVTLAVTPVNHPPSAPADTYATDEDAPLAVFAPQGALANDSDVDPGTTLSASVVTGPAHGSLTLNPDGSFLYTPAANFHGDDGFTYRLSDGAATADASATIHVRPVNDLPVASPRDLSLAQGRPSADGLIVATFTDADSEPATGYAATIDWGDGSAPTAGAVSGSGGSYTVAAAHVYDVAGSYAPRITIADPGGGSTTAFAHATVAPIGATLSGAPALSGNRTPDGAFLTSEPTPTIAGTAPSGFVVQAFATSGGVTTSVGRATAGTDNTFRLVTSALPEGLSTLTLAATNPAPGSKLAMSAPAGSVFVDTRGPRIVSTSFNLKAGTATVVFADAGSGLDTSLKLSPAQFTVSTIQGKKAALIAVTKVDPASPSSSQGASAMVLTLKKARLPKGSYAVRVAAGAVRDLAGNPFAGTAASSVAHPRGHVAAFARKK